MPSPWPAASGWRHCWSPRSMVPCRNVGRTRQGDPLANVDSAYGRPSEEPGGSAAVMPRPCCRLPSPIGATIRPLPVWSGSPVRSAAAGVRQLGRRGPAGSQPGRLRPSQPAPAGRWGATFDSAGRPRPQDRPHGLWLTDAQALGILYLLVVAGAVPAAVDSV
jgi:hypothetical protein